MRGQVFKTELEALIACRNHWQFMEITNNTQKNSYKPSILWDNNCAVCHFVGVDDFGYRNCQKCPLKGYAWYSHCEVGKDGFDSFYQRWFYSTYKNKGHWANRMVYACNQAIENLLLNRKG